MTPPVENSIRLKIHSNASMTQTAEFLQALDGLLRAVSEKISGDPGAVKWSLASFRVVCDGCGTVRTVPSMGWAARDGLDYCPRCSPALVEIEKVK